MTRPARVRREGRKIRTRSRGVPPRRAECGGRGRPGRRPPPRGEPARLWTTPTGLERPWSQGEGGACGRPVVVALTRSHGIHATAPSGGVQGSIRAIGSALTELVRALRTTRTREPSGAGNPPSATGRLMCCATVDRRVVASIRTPTGRTLRFLGGVQVTAHQPRATGPSPGPSPHQSVSCRRPRQHFLTRSFRTAVDLCRPPDDVHEHRCAPSPNARQKAVKTSQGSCRRIPDALGWGHEQRSALRRSATESGAADSARCPPGLLTRPRVLRVPAVGP
ncbi:hypothetical protein ABIC27_000923 [Streptomyces sp. PvR034]